jgi:hypothetical protein
MHSSGKLRNSRYQVIHTGLKSLHWAVHPWITSWPSASHHYLSLVEQSELELPGPAHKWTRVWGFLWKAEESDERLTSGLARLLPLCFHLSLRTPTGRVNSLVEDPLIPSVDQNQHTKQTTLILPAGPLTLSRTKASRVGWRVCISWDLRNNDPTRSGFPTLCFLLQIPERSQDNLSWMSKNFLKVIHIWIKWRKQQNFKRGIFSKCVKLHWCYMFFDM